MYKAIFSEQYALLLDWLVTKRKEHGLSQRALAATLQVHHSIVGKIEVRERRLDIIEYLQYCQALQLDPVEGIRIMATGSHK